MSCAYGANDCRTNDRAVRKSNQVATGIRYYSRVWLVSPPAQNPSQTQILAQNPFVFAKVQMKLIRAKGVCHFPWFPATIYYSFVCLKVSCNAAHPQLPRNAHKSLFTATAMLRTCSINQRLYANIDKVNIEVEKICPTVLKREYSLKVVWKLISTTVRFFSPTKWIFKRR